MWRYLAGRLLYLPIVLWVLVTMSFFLIRAAPGDPMANERSRPPEIQEMLRAKYHLDDPLLVQYVYYLRDLLHGDLGLSTKFKDRTVNEIVSDHLPVSLLIGCVAMIIAVIFGVGSGIIAAMRQNTWVDYSAMTVAMVGISTPTFVVAPLAMLLFSVILRLLPTSGWAHDQMLGGDTMILHTVALVLCVAIGLALIWAVRMPSIARWPLSVAAICWPIAVFGGGAYMVLPAVTLALPFMARISRLARTGMLEVIRSEFIKTARSKGLHEPLVIGRHALRGAMLPVVSYLGPASANILVGSLVVERVFVVPGIGSEFVNSAFNRDYSVVLGLVIVYGTMLVLFNLLVDIAYSVLDPRISYD